MIGARSGSSERARSGQSVRVSNRDATGSASILRCLIGDTITTMMFVHDYLRIEFQYGSVGPFLDCFAWPVVSIEGIKFRFSDPGYRDALCALIGRDVTRVEESHHEGIVVECGSCLLRMKPQADELTGPEIALFNTARDRGTFGGPGKASSSRWCEVTTEPPIGRGRLVGLIGHSVLGVVGVSSRRSAPASGLGRCPRLHQGARGCRSGPCRSLFMLRPVPSTVSIE